jgi:hypothetical protein
MLALALALALEVVSRLARQHLSICTPAIYETDEGSTTKHRSHGWAHSRLLRLERVPSSVDALVVAFEDGYHLLMRLWLPLRMVTI